MSKLTKVRDWLPARTSVIDGTHMERYDWILESPMEEGSHHQKLLIVNPWRPTPDVLLLGQLLA